MFLGLLEWTYKSRRCFKAKLSVRLPPLPSRILSPCVRGPLYPCPFRPLSRCHYVNLTHECRRPLNANRPALFIKPSPHLRAGSRNRHIVCTCGLIAWWRECQLIDRIWRLIPLSITAGRWTMIPMLIVRVEQLVVNSPGIFIQLTLSNIYGN